MSGPSETEQVSTIASAQTRRKRSSTWPLSIAIGAVVAVIVYFLSTPGHLLQLFELKAIDQRFRLRGERHCSEDIALVLVDEKSVTAPKYGQWPWPRTIHAKLVDRLRKAGAKAIVFDMLFVEPTTEDEELAKASATAGNVFFAAYALRQRDPVPGRGKQGLERCALRPREIANTQRAPAFATIRPPVTALCEAGKVGFVTLAPDADGVFRRCFLTAFNQEDGKLYPSLPLAVAQSVAGIGDDAIAIDFRREMRLGEGRAITLDGRGQATIDFAGPSRLRRRYSYVDVLDQEGVAEELRGCIVIVGCSASGLYDAHPNPFSPDFLGPEVNADIIENLLGGSFLAPADSQANATLLVALAIAAAVAASVFRPLPGAVVTVLLIVLFELAAILLFVRHRIVVQMVPQTVAAAAAFLVVTVRNLVSEESGRRRLHKHFAAYAPAEVVAQLDGGEVRDLLQGVRQEITVMFADIRGFTGMCARMEPERVVEMLNRYFSAMTEITFAFEGTVDKYVGDEIVVLFNALRPQPDHAKRAVFTALEMQERLDSLNEEWTAEGFPDLRIGIGINTGQAVVGNVGSQVRMDYTAIGETVSLASRLQELTKQFEGNILIAEATHQQLDEMVKTRPLGAQRLRGIPVPVVVYDVVGRAVQSRDS